MKIVDYITDGGKNLIKKYLHDLPDNERREGYEIRHKIILYGLDALDELNTRQLYKKLWEIKFSQNRIMYIIADENRIYFVHICKKQKGKAEIFELEKAKTRVREIEKELDQKFI